MGPRRRVRSGVRGHAPIPWHASDDTAELEGGDLAAIEIAWACTQTGPLATPHGEIPPTGRRMEIRSTQWVTARDGHTQAIDHHLDVMGIMSQLGVLPG